MQPTTKASAPQDAPAATKPQGIYKLMLWISIGIFALSALITVLMILFTDFNDASQRALFGRICFITWQTIWFGGLSVFFANRYDRNPLKLAKIVSLIGVGLAAIALIIGVGQALELYAISATGEKIQTIINMFLYSALFAELILLISRPIPSVVIARNLTVAVVGMFDFIAAILIGIDYATAPEMMGRLIAVFIILAGVGAIITCILNVIHKDQLPPVTNQAASNSPTFVTATPAAPIQNSANTARKPDHNSAH